MSDENKFHIYGYPRGWAGVLVLTVMALIDIMLLMGVKAHGFWYGLQVVGLVALLLFFAYRLVVYVKLSDDKLRMDTPLRSYTILWSEVESVRTILWTTSIKLRGRWFPFSFGIKLCEWDRRQELIAILCEKTNN